MSIDTVAIEEIGSKNPSTLSSSALYRRGGRVDAQAGVVVNEGTLIKAMRVSERGRVFESNGVGFVQCEHMCHCHMYSKLPSCVKAEARPSQRTPRPRNFTKWYAYPTKDESISPKKLLTQKKNPTVGP